MSDNTDRSCSEAKGGTLHVTMSRLLEHDFLQKTGLETLAKEVRSRKKRLGKDNGDLFHIAASIDPFFDDIADRERQIFCNEVLIDADDGEPKQPEEIILKVPGTIDWFTEGSSWRAKLSDQDWEWKSIRCRCFWFLHSNGDLSYHISLEMPYQHTLQYYFALALVQKVFFPTEAHPEKPFKLAETQSAKNLPDFLKDRFCEHYGRLLIALGINEPSQAQSYPTVREIADDQHGDPFERAVFLLEDACFDRVLRDRDRVLAALQEKKTILQAPASLEEEQNRVLDIEIWEKLSEDREQCREILALMFLSGYLQNVIDFFQQDISEFADGTDPLYPDSAGDDPHFLLFSTQEVMFEIVSDSRSLNKAKKYIGTCPYLFLVHITLFHDEALVKRFERSVEAMVRAVTEASVEDLVKIRKLAESFQKERLKVFLEVEKHMHLNVFRYDTEQSFYNAVTTSRGIKERQEHWGLVLDKLSNTVEGFHALAQQMSDAEQEQKARDLNAVVLAITVLSLFQLGFSVSDVVGKLQGSVFGFSLENGMNMLFLFLLFFVIAFVLVRREWRRSVWKTLRGAVSSSKSNS